ncbi:hypothetical protein A1Q2_07797 [Trichosporon asahii var. asahii CBS 8904]|uniref:F-box domain-containing protein n=2 Tax=Trichosporon asahii var. asahii TaxID=189963 RepID=K1VAY3_TRIAC|nr:hypothetical protein A1Q1_01721 [Trichosporon asahii var. asahii CBS 2479]EJT49240.1 hypothetical protein A1Q1_01721 [Trichosporon asahii var. asahii CBS 2479]EKC98000.1 hypothetical protein A1Q2_07797 [Trichosporon asahii var. asahii CBS 8904]
MRRPQPSRAPSHCPRASWSTLAPELQLHVLSFLPYPELVTLSAVSPSVRSLVLTPALHRTLRVELPVRRPGLLLRMLPHVRHLTIRQRTQFSFRFLLPSGPSSPSSDSSDSRDEMRDSEGSREGDMEIGRIWGGLGRTGRQAPSASLATHQEVVRYISKCEALEVLDMSGVRLAWSGVWPLLKPPLRQLTARGCGICAPTLPSSMEVFDAAFNSIVCLDTLGAERLRRVDLAWNNCLTFEDLAMISSRELEWVNLRGIDAITREDVRRLERRWNGLKDGAGIELDTEHRGRGREVTPPPGLISPPHTPDSSMDTDTEPKTPPPQQRPWMPPSPQSPPSPVRIMHTALLESDDEQGYRQFIHQVTSGTVVAP